jgi:3-dehydroquinate synthase
VRTIPVRTASASYSVLVGKGLLASLRPRIEKAIGRKPRSIFVVTSPEIWALWSVAFLQSFRDVWPVILFLPSGEASKRMAVIETLAAQLSEAGADRSSLLIAFGGGVVGDAAGFLAAIYMRGIDYVQVPTTFLSQVDSSVGGKTGVNLKTGKNLIGAFHHPRLVVADLDLLSTLPASELRAGLFESIKAGFIRDRKLLNLMEEEKKAILKRDPIVLEKMIAASIRMKASVVGEDELESGLRMILNFGHTVGHALEAVAGYGTILHGEAVGYGMLAALEISRMRGLAEKDYARAVSLIHAYGLPSLPRLSAQKLFAKTAGDKKNSSGKRRFVLLSKPSVAYVTDSVSDIELRSGISTMLAYQSPAARS